MRWISFLFLPVVLLLAVACDGDGPPTFTPTVAPPTFTPRPCHPSYEGVCLDPNASDYDCLGDTGDGPLYASGPFRVVGPDVFGLDRDGNRILGGETGVV